MSEYIIVIEVDNKRALAAYQRGMDDLELIWPQIESYCEKVDTESQARYAEEMRKYEIELKRYNERQEEHRRKVKEWEGRRKRSWLSDPPRPQYPYFDFPDMPFARLLQIMYYESIRNELRHMRDLAGAAVAPYRMTESRVREMIKWEDGTRIDEIKRIVTP